MISVLMIFSSGFKYFQEIFKPFLLFIFHELGLLTIFDLSCSFPSLSCEFASIDVSDVLGTVSLGLLMLLHFLFLVEKLKPILLV